MHEITAYMIISSTDALSRNRLCIGLKGNFKNELCVMCMALIHMLYYIIRAANRNNRHFHLLITNKNLQTPTRSLNVKELNNNQHETKQ